MEQNDLNNASETQDNLKKFSILKEMSDEQINIAIAEACGWTEIDGLSAKGLMGKPPSKLCSFGYLPDYCNDLNAIHKAVMTLPENKQVLYGVRLAWECGHTDKKSVGLWHISTATAYHHAVAFLKTLEKWEEAAK